MASQSAARTDAALDWRPDSRYAPALQATLDKDRGEMSSQMSRRPVFRLTLGYPILTVAAEARAEDRPPEGAARPARAAPAAPTEIDLSRPRYADQLRALGVAIRRARGTLRVVLPEAEVWRGLVAGPEAEAAARRAAAAALGTAPAALVLVAGPPGAEGRPFAAATRATLSEARAFLRRHGLRPAAFAGAGAFPGFPATPRFPAGVEPGPRLLAALAGRARALRPALPGLADLLPGWPPSGAFVAGGGLSLACAAVALVAALAPEAAPRIAAPILPVASATGPAAPDFAPRLAPAPAAPLALAEARPPALRPEAGARPRPAERDTRLAMSAPAPARPAALGGPALPEPIVVMATRNMPELEGAEIVRDGGGAPRVAELAAGPLPRAGGAASAPRPRPFAARAAATSSPPAAILDETGAILRPAPRATLTAAEAPAPGAASARPRPRLAADRSRPLSPAITAAVAGTSGAEPVRLASLSPAIPTAAALSRATPPEPRPETRSAARPEAPRAALPPQPPAPVAPRVIVTVEPVRASPSGDLVRPAAQAQPPRVAVAQPQPQPQLQAQGTRETRRAFAAAGASRAAETRGIARGSLSLLGVFGTKSARHALIRLPNGAVQRVRAGDTVAGAEVAAVAQDSVRLTSGGRETVLRIQ